MVEETRWIDFQPHKEDLSKVLGDLEAVVMRALWEIHSGNVREIHELVNRERKAAVTTIATILDRLHSKGLVERGLVKTGNIHYKYSPSMTRKQFEGTVVRNVFKGLFETFGDSAISYLVQSTGIEDEATIEEIVRNLNRLKEESE
jgi:predicted transcriptional regulator